jgi:flagellar protein FliO/FliZ
LPWPVFEQLSIKVRRADGTIVVAPRGELLFKTHRLIIRLGDGGPHPRVDFIMLRFMRLVALSVAAAALASPANAENTPAPPDWQDGGGASVYLRESPSPSPAAATEEISRYAAAREPTPFVAPADVIALPAASSKAGTPVTQAAHEESAAPHDSAARRLAPPSNRNDTGSLQAGQGNPRIRRLTEFGVPVQSIYTVITALAIVLGAFLLFAWALRRGGKYAGSRRGMLPADAVSVLGRTPLAARQFAELLRVGNKLVLVAMTPAGPTTLTEVTDPVEVDRLVGLCQQIEPHSTTKAFEQIFQQLSHEPAGNGFLGSDPLPTSISTAASAYRSHRGTARV